MTERERLVTEARRKLKRYETAGTSGTRNSYSSSRDRADSSYSTARERSDYRRPFAYGDYSTTSSRRISNHVDTSPERLSSSTQSLRQLTAQLQDMISETSTAYAVRGSEAAGALSSGQRFSSYTTPTPDLLPAAAGRSGFSYAGPAERERSGSFLQAAAQRSVPRPFQVPYRQENVSSAGTSLQVASLQEQIKLHKQTIDSLIREKTDADQAIADYQQQCSEKEVEAQQLQSSLSTCEQRIKQLEANATELQEYLEQHTNAREQQEKENAQLSSSVADLGRHVELLTDQSSSLSSQLQAKSEEYERLVGEKDELEKRLQEAGAHLHEATEQYDSAARHSDECRQQLTRQVAGLSEEYGSAQCQLEEKNQIIISLQEQLSLKTGEQEVAIQKATQRLTEENRQLSGSLSTAIEEKKSLHKRVVDQQDEIHSLDTRLAQLVSRAQTDHDRLTADSQQKTNLARGASIETARLQHQLQELQSSMSDVRAERQRLSDRLETESRVLRDVEQQLHQKTTILREVQQQLLGAQRERDEVCQVNSRLSAQLSSQASSQAGQTFKEEITGLQSQLSSAQMSVQQLLAERAELVEQLNRAELTAQQSSVASEKGHLMAEVVASLQQQVQVYQQQVVALQRELQLRNANAVNAPPAGFVPRERFDTVQKALDDLQTRFKEVMLEKAELVERHQSLEHSMLQLEGESSTISEYITLYHSEREELQKKYAQKDEYLGTLRKEHAAMSMKVEELQRLVVELVREKENHMTTDPTVLSNGHGVDGGVSPSPASHKCAGEGTYHEAPGEKTQKILGLLNDLKAPTGSCHVKSPREARFDLAACSCCHGDVINV